MKPTLAELHAVHLEWLGVKSSLIPAERRAFVRWVVRAHPELAAPYQSEPAHFRLLCQEVQRSGGGLAAQGIGEATLRRYAGDLMRYYLTCPETERGKFQDFVNRILKEYPTKRAFQRFVQSILVEKTLR